MDRRLARREGRRLPAKLPSQIDPDLGKRMHSRAMVLHGRLTIQQWQLFIVEIAHAMRMSPVGPPAVWHYPVDGAGGNGATVMQPITESFLVLDTWPDHDGAYLIVASCRDFSPQKFAFIVARYGLIEGDVSDHITLRLA